MSAFTDDDLKRLKVHLETDKEFHENATWVEHVHMDALLARLEASEKERDELRQLLAKERDEFGAKETKLIKRMEAAEMAIKYLRIVQEDDGESIEYSSGVRDEADTVYEAWRAEAM